MPALVPKVDLIGRTFEISRVCEDSVAGKPDECVFVKVTRYYPARGKGFSIKTKGTFLFVRSSFEMEILGCIEYRGLRQPVMSSPHT